ncbi:MAG: BON domain-containing protein [Terriglobales bacterium]
MNAKRGALLLVLAVVLATVFTVACNRGTSDAEIAGQVVTRINSDAKLTSKQISVTSQQGVVTLAGKVASDAERSAAAQDAAQIAGVKTVVNDLTVDTPVAQQPEQPQPEPLAQSVARAKPSAARRAARREPVQTYRSPVASTPSTTTYASAAPATYTPPPPPAPPRPMTVPSGTTLSIRMIDSIDTGRNHAGDSFRATLDAPITIDDKVVIPEGADVVGRIVDLKDAGHFAGRPELALELTNIQMGNRKYGIQTNKYSQVGKSRGTNTAEKVGAGAGIGAIIGAIAGGGKGAAIGGVIGAGTGGGVQAATKAQQVHIPTEALLTFRLESPITVTPVAATNRRSADNSYDSGPQPQTRWSRPPQQATSSEPDYPDSTTSDPTGSSPDSSMGPLPGSNGGGQQSSDPNGPPVLKRRPGN